jgi:hypothetical protein
MPFKPKGVEVHVESRARDQARWLIRDHGDDAEDVLLQKLRRGDKRSADKYRYRLTLREMRGLRREDPERFGSGKPLHWTVVLRNWFGRY